MPQITVIMDSDEHRLLQGFRRIAQEQAKIEAGFMKTGQAAKRVGDQQENAFGTAALGKMAAYAGGVLGIGTAIDAVTSKYESWKQRILDVSDTANQAAKEIVTLAALQEGGTAGKRVMETANLAGRYGVANRAEAFDTVQMIQSMLTSAQPGRDPTAVWNEAMGYAGEVFMATQLGIPIEFAKEAVVQAVSANKAPTEFLRKGYKGGQISGRSPMDVIRAAPALSAWEDKDVGIAVASILAERFGNDTETFLMRGGQILGNSGELNTGKDGKPSLFARLGLKPDASQYERLKALAGAGMDTEDKLKAVGVNEIREARALALAVSRFGIVDQAIRDVRGAGSLSLAGERANVEQNTPGLELQRLIDMASVQYGNAKAFGPQAEEAQRERLLGIARGMVLKRRGIQPHDFISDATVGPDGYVGPYTWGWTRFGYEPEQRARELFGAPVQRPLDVDVEAVIRELRETSGNLVKATENLVSSAKGLDAGAGRLKAGPSGVPEDK